MVTKDCWIQEGKEKALYTAALALAPAKSFLRRKKYLY